MGYPEILDSVLQRVHAVLEEGSIWHCLIYGTLLGAVRDGGIIEWDHDIDLLIRPADIPAIIALEDRFGERDLHLWRGKTPGRSLALNPSRVPWFEQGTISVTGDAEWAYGEMWAPTVFCDGVLRSYDIEADVICWPESSFAAYFIERLDTIEMGGVAYPVPRDADALLRWLYGPDWQIPYRSIRDGGGPKEGYTDHGTLGVPTLSAQVEWCIQQGWDRSPYVGAPNWPRQLRGAGPRSAHGRAAGTSGSNWWHSLEEITANY